MGNPTNGEERRSNLLSILGGDLKQWWSKLGVWEKIARVAISLVTVGFLAGGWWFSVQSAYGPLPERVKANHSAIQEQSVRLNGVERDVQTLESDVTRIDLRQDSIVRALDRIEGAVVDTRCWARVSAEVADASECIQDPR